MTVTVATAGFPEQVWLGIKSGEWPVQAFINAEQAKYWAGQPDARRRYVIGPVPVGRNYPVLTAKSVPSSYEWVEEE